MLETSTVEVFFNVLSVGKMVHSMLNDAGTTCIKCQTIGVIIDKIAECSNLTVCVVRFIDAGGIVYVASTSKLKLIDINDPNVKDNY